jgi:hypothetical protein
VEVMNMANVAVIEIKQLQRDKIIQFIDLAGFRIEIYNRYIALIDKKSRDADKYSDLTFTSLDEAIKAVAPYLKNQFKFVA